MGRPDAEESSTVIGVRPSRLVVPLAMAAVAMVIATVLGRAMRELWGIGGYDLLLRPFDVNAEGNVWTWFSSLLHVIVAGLCAVLAASRRQRSERHSTHFAGLAVVFLGVSIDETSALHEEAIEPIRDAIGASGLLYNAWVIPASVLVAGLAVAYWPWLRHLPRDVARLIFVAVALFVGGGMGVELLTGARKEIHGGGDFTFGVLTAIEESLEAAGLILLIYALLGLVARERCVVQAHPPVHPEASRRISGGS